MPPKKTNIVRIIFKHVGYMDAAKTQSVKRGSLKTTYGFSGCLSVICRNQRVENDKPFSIRPLPNCGSDTFCALASSLLANCSVCGPA